jgi:Ser/Thr protein kinase RdoA (MazF antagonist)
VGLIDLDRAGLGNPANDLASWIAAEHLAAVASAEGSDLLLPAPLLEGYRSVGGSATDEQIAQQVPLELLRRASDPFRMRAHDWPEQMAAIIDAAVAAADVRVPS